MTIMRPLPALLLVVLLVIPVRAADLPTGLVKDKPVAGRYVETDRGFMVPYTQKIPGTEIEFSMEPIPGGTFKLGSPASEADRSEDEGPQIEVTIEPFWMGDTR